MAYGSDMSFPFYPAIDGSPLEGVAYFGVAGQNPVTNPVTVYWDSAATQPASQPVTISGGRTVRSDGTPSRVWVASDFSLLVQDGRKRQVVFEPNQPLTIAASNAISQAAAQVTLAAGQVALAATQVGIATTQAAAAAGSQSAAQAAQAAAEAARDAINTSGKVFTAAEGTAAGIAATTSGQGFAVVDASLTFYIVYRNNAGVATEVVRNYTKGFVDALVDDYGDSTAFLYAIIDSARRRLAAWNADGTMVAKLGVAIGVANGLTFTRNADGTYTLSLGTIQGEVPVGSASLLRGEYDNADYLYAITDSAGRKLLTVTNDGTVSGKITNTEVIAARAARVDLNTRVSQHLNDYGLPKRHRWGEWYLRETRQRLRKRLLGESQQFTIASIGDSWTQASTRYSGPSASTLKTTYGDAGPGWTGFAWGFGGTSDIWSGGNGNINPLEVTVALSANWSTHYATSASPDVCDIFTSTAAAKVTVGFAGTGNTSAVVLYYIAGTAGSVRYRWNAGAWTTIDTGAGSGLLTASLTAVPTGTWTLEIENLTGTTTLCGVDVKKSTDGVRWHKLGATGSAASHWVAPTAAQWQAGLTALAPDLVTILLGTNDQGAAVPAATLYSRMGTLVDRVRAAVPLADVLLIMPCANGSYTTPPMTDYAKVVYQLASEKKCAFMDLQYLFGDSFSEYASTSPRAWFNVDNIHPEPTTGGRVIVDGFVRLLTNV